MAKNKRYIVKWGQPGKKGVGQIIVFAATEKEAESKAKKQLKVSPIVIIEVILEKEKPLVP